MKVSEYFGENVFSRAVMQERLPKKVYAEVMSVVEHGGQISMASADVVAKAMMEWAIEKGATHYTHWFQPLTGVTAEKHDSFLSVPDENGKEILNLTGKQLIMGEPDASSFPSGGLRSTHYARGYTAWDMTSPAFVKEMACGTILCIPTVFVAYSGEALDNKTPLLRSMQSLSQQAVRILHLFGNTQAERVIPSVGAEQEYFIVDREKYLKRRDLIYTGRTLFGAPAPKGQELDDQYFGVIRERVGAFMKDLNKELWKMGITATTQHNEVAPAQHECAPIYCTCNVAVDQNQLMMETMKRVATQHGLVCLLHEKPFAGVNGSGKHNNWSITSDLGENLLDPGKTPNDNLQFLLVLSCIIKAVDRHADLLRMSTACVGNDHRLGANEAPPAIVSIFLGNQLEDVVEQIVKNGTAAGCIAGGAARPQQGCHGPQPYLAVRLHRQQVRIPHGRLVRLHRHGEHRAQYHRRRGLLRGGRRAGGQHGLYGGRQPRHRREPAQAQPRHLQWQRLQRRLDRRGSAPRPAESAEHGLLRAQPDDGQGRAAVWQVRRVHPRGAGVPQ